MVVYIELNIKFGIHTNKQYNILHRLNKITQNLEFNT